MVLGVEDGVLLLLGDGEAEAELAAAAARFAAARAAWVTGM